MRPIRKMKRKLKYVDCLMPLGAGDDTLLPLTGDLGLLPLTGDLGLLALGASDDLLLPLDGDHGLLPLDPPDRPPGSGSKL